MSRTIGVGLVLILLLVGGTAGYMAIEGWSFLDAAYMTVITLTTVGFGEPHDLSSTGRWFTMVLILLGVGIVAYALSSTYELIASPARRQRWRLKRTQKMIDQLRQHVIVCGYGRLGREVARNLKESGIPFVVVEIDEVVAETVEQKGMLVCRGDASEEGTLERAGIQHAKALVASCEHDAANVFIVVTARALNPDFQIISGAQRGETEPKLRRAGADRVVAPYPLVAQRVSSLVSRPAVTDFLDVVMHSGDLELRLDEVKVAPTAPVANKSLAEIRAREIYGVTILAIVPPGRPALTAPQANDRLEVGARVVALGTADALEGFSRHLEA